MTRQSRSLFSLSCRAWHHTLSGPSKGMAILRWTCDPGVPLSDLLLGFDLWDLDNNNPTIITTGAYILSSDIFLIDHFDH